MGTARIRASFTPSFPTLFADSSDIEQIDPLVEAGLVKGITTNPVIVAKHILEHPKSVTTLEGFYQNLANRYTELPISVQLPDEPLDKLRELARIYKELAPNIVIKIPMFPDERGLKLISELSSPGKTLPEKRIRTNVTALMSAQQALFAMLAGNGVGPDYLSLFYNRIKDPLPTTPGNSTKETFQGDPQQEIRRVRDWIEAFKLPTKIIAGSIRNFEDIPNAGLAGAHIVTVKPELLGGYIHPKSRLFIAECRSNLERVREEVLKTSV